MTLFYPASHHSHYSISEPKEGHQLTHFKLFESRPQLPFIEAQRACQLIYERYKSPLMICFSGGIDSECVAQAAIAAKVPFELVIMRLSPSFNDHDTVYALEFCEKVGKKPIFIDLSIIRFYESGEFLQYAMKYRTNSPQFATHLWLAEQIQGVPVFAGSFPYINYFDREGKELEESYLYTSEDKEYGVDRLFQQTGRGGVGHFFQYTPELYFSFLTHTIAGSSKKKRIELQLGTHYDMKEYAFAQGGFNTKIVTGRSQKYTGFEKVKEYYAARYGIGDTYEKLFREPLQRIFPKKKSVRTLLPKAAEQNFFYNSQE